MQAYVQHDLAEAISDRGMGTRFRFVTGLTPDDGEKVLYHKGKEMALCVWANAYSKADDHKVMADIEKQWLPKFNDLKAVKLVPAKLGDKKLDAYYMIGDISQGIEVLRSDHEFGISSMAAEALLGELAKAKKQKAQFDKARTPKKS